MKKCIIDTDGILAFVASLNSRIDNISELFSKINEEMRISKDKQIWMGNTSDALYSKYDTFSSNYEAITTSMGRVAQLYSYIADAYIKWDLEMQKLAETYDLDVNTIQ